jgi:hypothetical protein
MSTTIFIIIAVIAIVMFCVFVLPKLSTQEKKEKTTQPEHFDLLDENGNPIRNIPEKLMDLNITTVAERQRVYKRGFRTQLQYDELQRRAQAAGDTETLEAIRLGTYNGPLPELEDDVPHLKLGGGSDTPVQEFQYFCVKDKGYHVSVWPKNQGYQGLDYIEFDIADLTHGEHVDDHLGEFIANLIPEPINPYDANAIKIVTSNGHRIGYVPKSMTQDVRDFAKLPCKCYCYIGTNDGMYFSDCYIKN